MRPLSPELLRSFVAVVQTGSFTLASERVSLSQSTVSQHVRRLEDILGCALLERDTRNVRPTRQGDALFHYAGNILGLMEEAFAAVSGPALNGTVRLGLSEDFASLRLTAALASFQQRNPEVELHIATGMSGDLFRELDEDKHDLVFAKRVSGSQRGQVVRTEKLYWCVGPMSPITGGEAVLPLALHPEPSVSRTRVLETLKAIGRPHKISTVSSSVAVLKAAAMAGLGISAFADYVIPEGLVKLEHGMPLLGELEFVIDRATAATQVVVALESTIKAAAIELQAP